MENFGRSQGLSSKSYYAAVKTHKAFDEIIKIAKIDKSH